MKRKTAGSILVVILVLVLLTATAFAAYTLMRSAQTDAISRARRALLEDYGLTVESLGLFMPVAEQEGETWTVTFHAFGLYPPLLGDYTVLLPPDAAPQTHWTHDAVDAALWQDGALTAPVWGQRQLAKALQDPEAAEAITMPLFQREQAGPTYTGPALPDDLADDEAIWNEQRIKHSAPTEDAISQEVACDLAKQAVTAETGLPIESLVPPPDTTTFYTRATGNPIWGFQFIANENGIEYDCGVMLDAYTGEILTIGLITGGGNE